MCARLVAHGDEGSIRIIHVPVLIGPLDKTFLFWRKLARAQFAAYEREAA